MRISTKVIETLKVSVSVVAVDIKEGECRLPGKCMEKVAIERSLREIDPKGGDHKVRIDGGSIRFNLRDHHWSAPTPRKPKLALIQFDKEEKARKRALKLGTEFVSKVKPHSWKFVATKGDKILPFTEERQKAINEARRKRVAEGRPDRVNYNLHKRVVGLGNV